MSKDNWLTIAAIITAIMMTIATLMAPSLAEFVKFRLSQPTATPETNTVNKLMPPKILDWAGFGIIAIALVSLLFEWFSTTPLTRSGVIRISAWLSFIVIGSMLTTITRLVRVIALMAETLILTKARVAELEAPPHPSPQKPTP
jgi:hypothetical protein